MKQTRFWLHASLLFIMLFIQYGAAVHASKHFFHHHDHVRSVQDVAILHAFESSTDDYDDALCDLYIAAERLVDTQVSCDFTPALSSIDTAYLISTPLGLCESRKPSPRSRSPPAFS
jgi:hypothetical protein